MSSAVLDTEFASLQLPAILFVGLVTSDGAELYLEVDPDSAWGRQTLAASSEFVREVVAPQLGFARASDCASADELARRVRSWISQHGLDVIHADSDIDFFLLRALGALPPEVATVVVQAAYPPAHHALEDSRRLAAALARSG